MTAYPAPIEHSDEDADSAAEAEGRADLDAGRVVTGDAVKRWLRSWGTPDERLAPRLGD